MARSEIPPRVELLTDEEVEALRVKACRLPPLIQPKSIEFWSDPCWSEEKSP
jgi:hypothetical protein